MLLIGLGHKARQGKDTFANSVYEAYTQHFGIDVRIASFADPMRREIEAAATTAWSTVWPGKPFIPDEAMRLLCKLMGVEFEENAPIDVDYPWGKQRRLCQWWGTDYRRAQDPRYWVNKVTALIQQAQTTGAHVFILRDLRFSNEFDMIGSLGGYRIKVSRLGYVSDVPQHISETELDDAIFDLNLGVRDGLYDVLKRQAVAMTTDLLLTSLTVDQREELTNRSAAIVHHARQMGSVLETHVN